MTLSPGPERLPDVIDNELSGNDPEAMTVAASLTGATISELFRNRNFMPLWFGQAVSYIGDQFTLIAVLSVIGGMAGTASLLYEGGVAIANALPTLILGLVGGVLVDRLNRKWVMIACDVVRGLALFSLILVGNGQTFGIPSSSLFLVNHDLSRLWLFFAAEAITGAAGTLFYPARASILPAIVSRRQLAAANALLEAGFVIALILGPVLASILIGSVGASWAFALNGTAYFFSALMIFVMRIPPRALQPEITVTPSVGSDLRAGLRYIWQTRSLRYIMALSVIVAIALGAVLILDLNYLQNTLKVGQSSYGFVIGVLGVGIVVGGVLIQRLSRYLPTNRLVAAAMALNGLSLISFIAFPSFAVVCVLTALIGFSVVIARAVLGTLVQAIPPEEYRGRVQSAFNLIFTTPFVTSIALATVLSQIFIGREWVVFGGFGIALLLTAYAAIVLLRGIDEAVYNAED